MASVAASLWAPFSTKAGKLGVLIRNDIEAAGMNVDPERFVWILIGIASVAWFVLLLAARPAPVIAIPTLLGCLGVTILGGRLYLKRRRNARVAVFRDQLEGALRTLAGGVRVGLGIRQALVLTSEQSRDPAKSEFMRVVGLGNVGVSTLDALDQLAARMRTTETEVFARVVRVQAEAGGDLASVLEGLAGTIRDRRRLGRRVKAVTAQGRATAWLLGLLPLAMGAFMLTQVELRDAMLFTLLGRIFLALALGLDGLAITCLIKITQVDA